MKKKTTFDLTFRACIFSFYLNKTVKSALCLFLVSFCKHLDFDVSKECKCFGHLWLGNQTRACAPQFLSDQRTKQTKSIWILHGASRNSPRTTRGRDTVSPSAAATNNSGRQGAWWSPKERKWAGRTWCAKRRVQEGHASCVETWLLRETRWQFI